MKNIPKSNHKIWRVKKPVPSLNRILARKLGISPVTAQLLINRGIYTVEEGRAFLDSELARLHPPLLLKDLDKAVNRVLKAAGAGEKILVYGDYDADGITATALLVQVFRRLGADVDYYIPHRLAEGYGLHQAVLQKTRGKGTALVVTVDCGISAVAEAVWAGENGLDLIITDHHEPPEEIPRAFAVINPKRPGCDYPFKELAGVGVALKLAQAIMEAAGMGTSTWQEYLDLVCLGTIADIVPIRGENRILVKHGLPALAATGNPGLRALMAVSGTKKEDLGPREVAFGLVPRLNAAGRVGSPLLAARLLLTDDGGLARELALELDRGNQARQEIEAAVLEEALGLLKEDPGLAEARVLVLASENWHPGVTGIVAARLVERFYRPALLIALEGPLGKGSARSIPEFNIYGALNHCRELLLAYGGHAMAAGLSIEAGRVADFREKINAYAGEILGDKQLIPQLVLDGIIDLSRVSEDLAREIDLLRPFGHANPRPLLGCLKTPVLESRGVGREAAHLKLRLRGRNNILDGIGFRLGAYAEVVATAEMVDLAFVPGINEYNGRRSVQLEIKDLGTPARLDVRELESRGVSDPVVEYANSSGTLVENLEELFTPEYVLETIARIKTGNRPPGAFDEGKITNVELVDHRGSGDRPGRLAGLVFPGEPTMVITSCGYQTIELAHYLRLAGLPGKGKAAFCHGCLSRETKVALAAGFEVGEITTVVATPAMAGLFERCARQVLLYNLPFGPETVNSALDVLEPGGRLGLLFNPADMQENLAVWKALAPDREYLACFYRLLRRVRNGGDEVSLSPGQAVRMMAEAGFHHGREYTVTVALIVLEEIGLLVNRGGEDFLKVGLLPAPPEKKDLLDAQTYKRLLLAKEESITWMRKLLNEPIHRLLDIREGVL